MCPKYGVAMVRMRGESRFRLRIKNSDHQVGTDVRRSHSRRISMPDNGWNEASVVTWWFDIFNGIHHASPQPISMHVKVLERAILDYQILLRRKTAKPKKII